MIQVHRRWARVLWQRRREEGFPQMDGGSFLLCPRSTNEQKVEKVGRNGERATGGGGVWGGFQNGKILIIHAVVDDGR